MEFGINPEISNLYIRLSELPMFILDSTLLTCYEMQESHGEFHLLNIYCRLFKIWARNTANSHKQDVLGNLLELSDTDISRFSYSKQPIIHTCTK